MRELHVIARDIRTNWKNVNYAAEPYLEAMFSMRNIKDFYGYDSGDSIVRYFLSNAAGWRGEHARRIKAELKAML
jgi:hypothetical protein